MKTRFNIVLAMTLLLLIGNAGCAGRKAPDKSRRTFGIAYRQLPPEPVYGRLRLAHLPDPLPTSQKPLSDAPRMLPVMHLELKNVSMRQAAEALAETARYSSYCDPELATRLVNFNSLGTIDELAQGLARANAVAVSVDHSIREVRITNKEVKPILFNTEVSGNEHDQSNN